MRPYSDVLLFSKGARVSTHTHYELMDYGVIAELMGFFSRGNSVLALMVVQTTEDHFSFIED